MSGGALRLNVVLDGGSGSDAVELAELTGDLRRRLLELDVARVELVRSEPVPPGAKPLDAVSIGALVVALTPGVLDAVVTLVGNWSTHRPVRSARLTIDGDSIEVTDAAAVDQQRLIELFVERHRRSPGR